jgi:AcrR family transcriptional regulator
MPERISMNEADHPIRTYQQTERARSALETRARIVAAALALHETAGPARTTISAIAERAGVQRLTVYRHFPDESALLAACVAEWESRHPAPDPASWAAVGEPAERMRIALGELYAHFRATESLTRHLRRDAEELPALQAAAAPLAAREASGRVALERGWELRGRRHDRLRAVIGHATAFETWRSLARGQALGDAEIAELMVAFARSL